ncbi:MAG: branched-chain amino acid ABC transporter permease [Anaerolineae bacterium]|nr:branched-chain amino acid ABC transporter permease [Anaerolineae bacterium]
MFNEFWVTYGSVVQFVLINMILGISIYFTLYTGLLSLANAGFMAVGAYISALLSIHTQLPFVVCLLLGALFSALIGFLLGLPVLRLRDVYLAIATLGFGEIVRIIAINFDNFTHQELLGGPQGLANIPKLTNPPILILTLVILSVVVAQLPRSRFGRALAAIRQDESVAATMGINVFRYKLLAFTLGAFVAGLAGGFSAHLTRFVGPNEYGFTAAVNILSYVVLGGTLHWSGALVGAAILTILPEALRFLNEYRGVVNGVILVLVIIYLPQGLVNPAWIKRLFSRKEAA